MFLTTLNAACPSAPPAPRAELLMWLRGHGEREEESFQSGSGPEFGSHGGHVTRLMSLSGSTDA